MSETIISSGLTRDHLESNCEIIAFTETDAVAVWKSRKLPSQCRQEHAAREISRLYVKVDTTTRQGLQPLIDRLAAIDPLGKRRICA